MNYQRGDFTISTDPTKFDLDVICDYLARSYWAKNRPREVVIRSIKHARGYGVYRCDEQVGFARVVTDYALFAYLADVFILEPYQGQGLGMWLLEVIFSDDELRGLRRWCLATQDAHGLYERYGFTELRAPERWMERFNADT